MFSVSYFVTFYVVMVVFEGVEAENREDCDPAKAMNCLSSLVESTDSEALFFPDTEEKLRKYCLHLARGLECAHSIIDKCANEEDKGIYTNLTSDMLDMNAALCHVGSPMSSRFLKHVDCYKRHSERFNICSNRYIGNIVIVRGLSNEQQAGMTCCTVFEYSQCMKNVISGRCEKDADDLVEETVEKAMRSTLKYCNELQNVPRRDCRKKFASNPSHSSSNSIDYSSYDVENPSDACTKSKMSLLLLLMILLRYMLFR